MKNVHIPIGYNQDTNRYSLDVRLKAVHMESVLGSLDGTENIFLFGVDGPPRKSHGIETGPGAGVEETANAIMHDLLEINAIVRGTSQKARVAYSKYRSKLKPTVHNLSMYEYRQLTAVRVRLPALMV